MFVLWVNDILHHILISHVVNGLGILLFDIYGQLFTPVSLSALHIMELVHELQRLMQLQVALDFDVFDFYLTCFGLVFIVFCVGR